MTRKYDASCAASAATVPERKLPSSITTALGNRAEAAVKLAGAAGGAGDVALLPAASPDVTRK